MALRDWTGVVRCRVHVEPGLVRVELRPSPLLLPGSLLCGLLVWWLLGVPLSRVWLAQLPMPALARSGLDLAPGRPAWRHGLMLVIASAALLFGSRQRTDVLVEERGDVRWRHSGLFRPADGSIPPDDWVALRARASGVVDLVHGDEDLPFVVALYQPILKPSSWFQAQVAAANHEVVALLQRRR